VKYSLLLLVLLCALFAAPAAHAQAQTCDFGGVELYGDSIQTLIPVDSSTCWNTFFNPDTNGGWYQQCDQYGYMIYQIYILLLGFYDPEAFAQMYGCFPY
jgi:hypothetical protein